jgi:hypothetical protein
MWTSDNMQEVYKIKSKSSFNLEIQKLVLSGYKFIDAIILLMEKYKLDEENIIMLIDDPIKERLRAESFKNNLFEKKIKVTRLKFK